MPDARTIATYDKKAADYARRFGADKPDASLQAFINLVPQGGRVLDLGCGPATASAHMRAAGLLPDPIDASPGMVKIANDTHDINARVATFDDISEEAVYDGVWANFSLLHAPRADLPRYFAALAGALRPDGVLHVGMKTGSGAARDAMDRFYTYVSVQELHALIAATGLTVTDVKEGEEVGLAGTKDPFVLMRARKDA